MAPRLYDPICSVEGCERKHYAHGYCQPHNQRFLKHGDPQADIPLSCRVVRRAPCAAEGCERAAHALGYCMTHYLRVKEHGDPLAHIPIKDYSRRGPKSKPPEERIRARAKRVGGCLIIDRPHDHVMVQVALGEFEGRQARRLMYESVHGELDCTLRVWATCENADRCVEPSHIAAGTEAECLHSQGRNVVGSKQGMAKLTEEKVAELRRRYRLGVPLWALANEVDMHPSTLSYAIRGKTWKHVPGAVPEQLCSIYGCTTVVEGTRLGGDALCPWHRHPDVLRGMGGIHGHVAAP